MSLLDAIGSPSHLRTLRESDLQNVADEIRAFILESVSTTGGHLAPSLGVVELTVALHYVFDTPRDRLVWDVGHQGYPHKILTGRKDAMATLRRAGGLAGFPSRDESPYDTFGVGHAGTSISAALGMAIGLRTRNTRVVAIIGDGALSAGMAYEALNHAGANRDLPLTIILNDNGMSISPAVGGLKNHLHSLTRDWRTEHGIEFLEGKDTAAQPGPGVRPPALFELLGLDYSGPIDGHCIADLVVALRAAREHTRPQVLHVVTQKGRGYRRAELDPVTYHGPGPFKLDTGVCAPTSGKLSFSQVFGQWICDAARNDERIFGITPAMREGSCLVDFEKQFPERYIDVGIAEQHAITVAGGLAVEGMRPVVAIYSTFLQRGYDQLIHDIALQNLPVLIAIDRAGIAGSDGATHLGAFDIAALRCVPNMVIMTPADENECYLMLNTGLAYPGPCAVRYPRASVVSGKLECTAQTLPIGKGIVRRLSTSPDTHRVALLVFGPLLSVAMEVAQEIDATVVNMRFAKPLDEGLLLEMAKNHDVLVTIEEATATGGAGAACAECIAAVGLGVRVLRLGLPDEFVPHGDRTRLLEICGLDVAGIMESIRAFAGRADMLNKV